MSPRGHAKPDAGKVDAAQPVASTPAPPPPSAADRIAALELDLEQRDATIAALRAELEARPSSPPAAPEGSSLRRRLTGPCGVTFRGRAYEDGEPFPFDPDAPPPDVSGAFHEGLHYRYA